MSRIPRKYWWGNWQSCRQECRDRGTLAVNTPAPSPKSPAATELPAPNLRVVVGSSLFMLGQASSTVVFALLALAIAPLPYRTRFDTITLWTRFNLWWLSTCCDLRHEILGRENIPAEPGVLLCKHESAWETMALQTLFRPQSWVLKRELLWIPFFGWGLALLKPIAIDRNAGRNAVGDLIRQGRQRLADGAWVVVFPEGTRVPPGETRPYQKGGAVLAKRAGATVTPIAHNAGDFWRRNSFLKYPGTIQLWVGPAINTDAITTDEVNRQAKAWIRDAVELIRSKPAPSGAPCGSIGGTP